jgi:hypothetical protein
MGIIVKKLLTYDMVSSPGYSGAKFNVGGGSIEDCALKFYAGYYFKGGKNLVNKFDTGMLPYTIKLLSYLVISEAEKKYKRDGVKLDIIFLFDNKYMDSGAKTFISGKYYLCKNLNYKSYVVFIDEQNIEHLVNGEWLNFFTDTRREKLERILYIRRINKN